MMSPLQALTAREQEMLDLICDGTTTDKELGERLGIAPPTVYTHMAAIFKKFGVRNRVELVVKVYKARLARYEPAA